ncbi:hypothetical protein [Rathayibacter toxicus]|uniref:Uncharacterized protein n=1 Tax=Rathayibacter toxicus TaxID=145458 RepID=A0A0C5BF89_9MICO|nr:hypothetical protein [Rathayibacter toxicus]AJM77976.1 hypothetical protein TI83_08540 [Rathayibacter toxicus]ALS57814.1 hypothetical protein APU90_08540 [Rathayibacter toxicus]KKM46985.1 hypothetical protein VT73_01680 [Rathayibacter toxicus]PPG20517.1 hypothetical protein C5D15_08385 [Rathayibacter toxicus]PPG45619.1 hypothetical protein C5D16_08355 [Rathayibacter toxicus]
MDDEEDQGVTDKQQLEALLPTTIVEAIPKYPNAELRGQDWLINIFCNWIRKTPWGTVTGNDDQPVFEAGFLSLLGRTIVSVECTDDAYDPIFTLDDGTTFQIIAEKDGDPWDLCGPNGIDVEGPGPGVHDDFMQDKWNFLPE